MRATILLVVLAAILAACDTSSNTPHSQQPVQASAAEPEISREAALEKQRSQRESEIAQLRAEAAALQPWQLTVRARVFGRLNELVPDDANVAAELKRANAEIDLISSLSDKAVCKKLKAGDVDAAYGQEYFRRGGNALDLSYIKLGQIQIGMTEFGLRCSWRAPDDVNSTAFNDYRGARQVHKQFVYGSGTYVYTENGVITTVQQ